MFLKHCFSENGVEGWLFIFIFCTIFAYKNDISEYLGKFSNLRVCSNQWVLQNGCSRTKNKQMAATGCQIKLTIEDL